VVEGRGASAITQPQPALKDGTPIGGTGRGNKFLPNTTDWLGRWRLAANASNNWGLDRAAQRSNAIFSGIDGIHLQDQAITESMGPITDHEHEHLAPSDQMITRTRRRLLMAARALRDRDVLPPGVENADVYREARSGYFVTDDDRPWQEVYAHRRCAGSRFDRNHGRIRRSHGLEHQVFGPPRVLTADIEAIAEFYNKESGGALEIKIAYGASLGPEREALEAIKSGGYEGALMCAGYYPNNSRC
jgi:hypothetical protein